MRHHASGHFGMISRTMTDRTFLVRNEPGTKCLRAKCLENISSLDWWRI